MKNTTLQGQYAKAMRKVDAYIHNEGMYKVFSKSEGESHSLEILTKQGDSLPLLDCSSQREAEELRDTFNAYIECFTGEYYED